MQIIDELEPHRRGPYAGAVGYIDYGGNMDTCIALRTLVVRGRTAYVQAGAGIVADSVPAAEYQETLNKAQGLLEGDRSDRAATCRLSYRWKGGCFRPAVVGRCALPTASQYEEDCCMDRKAVVLRRLPLGLLAVALLLSAGCSGCRRDQKPADKADQQQEEARKPDFQSKDLRVLPSDDTLAVQAVKPGHWFSVRQELKSNRSDFYGELDGRSGDQSGEPMPLRQSTIGVHTRRAVSLPKGQAKTFELTYFVPDPLGSRESGCTATCGCHWAARCVPSRIGRNRRRA